MLSSSDASPQSGILLGPFLEACRAAGRLGTFRLANRPVGDDTSLSAWYIDIGDVSYYAAEYVVYAAACAAVDFLSPDQAIEAANVWRKAADHELNDAQDATFGRPPIGRLAMRLERRRQRADGNHDVWPRMRHG